MKDCMVNGDATIEWHSMFRIRSTELPDLKPPAGLTLIRRVKPQASERRPAFQLTESGTAL